MAPRNLDARCLTPLFLLQFFFCIPPALIAAAKTFFFFFFFPYPFLSTIAASLSLCCFASLSCSPRCGRKYPALTTSWVPCPRGVSLKRAVGV